MSEAREELSRLATDVLAICFDAPEVARRYRELAGLSFDVASDLDRAAYRAYGLERAPLHRVLTVRTIAKYAQLLGSGMRLRRPLGRPDRLQMGGDFVVDPRGRLTFVHRSQRPEDRPPLESILAALHLA